jgi:hypothetical protein
MSQKLKINSARLIALRRSSRQLQILTALGVVIRDWANEDFWSTASAKNQHSQGFARSSTPYDIEARTGDDRVRVYVNTASMAARRHEASGQSSLLRALARRN